jgi:hypothetical protein
LNFIKIYCLLNDVIHIVCLDAPSPPNYGGAIDMYYKISSLANAGKKIILHYFDYHKNRDVSGLESFCSEIHSYERKSFFNFRSGGLPYIIRSRKNQSLQERLIQDNYPILLEGLHSTGMMNGLQAGRRVVIRMHNDEASYYRQLAATERNLFKSTYYAIESMLIERYMTRLAGDVKIAAISESDKETFVKIYGFHDVHFIPAFIPWQKLSSLTGKGEFCLYHGNMHVAENVAAATWLVEEVFCKVPVSFIVAGSGIPEAVIQWEKKYKNVQVINNPSVEQINHLVASAHINILPSMNQTGVKLKLLHSLFTGRFCITNSNGIKGTGIKDGAYVADEAADFISMIGELFAKEFTSELVNERASLLKIFDNRKNAADLSALL